MPSHRYAALPRYVKARFNRISAALIASVFIAGAATAQGQDGKAIMRDMADVYRGMGSYAGRATVDNRETLPGGRALMSTSFTVNLIYQKPNRLKIDFAMPSGGRSVYYDGATLTFYQNKNQTYTSVPVSAKSLHELEPSLRQFEVGSKLDTLSFLAGDPMPASLAALTRKPDESRAGKSLFVVTGRESSKGSPLIVTWTWWIDKSSHLLVKIQGRLSGLQKQVRVVQGKKGSIKAIKVEALLTQNILEARPGPTIDNKTFMFRPPPGATKVGAQAISPASKGK